MPVLKTDVYNVVGITETPITKKVLSADSRFIMSFRFKLLIILSGEVLRLYHNANNLP
jgi:hypothetical protein